MLSFLVPCTCLSVWVVKLVHFFLKKKKISFLILDLCLCVDMDMWTSLVSVEVR